jgi:hypothetical protein
MQRALKAAVMLACAAGAALAVGAGAGAAQPASLLQGTFTIQFPKGHEASNAPCPADEFCGVGSLAGFGPATVTILDESFEEIEGTSCYAVERVEQIDLLDGSGSLVIESSGTFCRPGGSGGSHAGPVSYGSPGRFEFVFTVNGSESTGIFAGATGGGTETMSVAGGIGVWMLSGNIILA